MSSLLPEIPLRFMRPSQKYALINWLVDLGLPARVTHRVISQWGAVLGVAIDPSDYEMLTQHLKTVTVAGVPVGTAGSGV